jgi:hypothetical protein
VLFYVTIALWLIATVWHALTPRTAEALQSRADRP